MKRPAFMFYPADHVADVRFVSLAARGLWMEMLCLMRQGHVIGYLTHKDGRAITIEQLARLVGESASTVRRLVSELEEAGIPSKTPDGAYLSRRMVRDEETYQQYRAGQAAAGRRGAKTRWKPHDGTKAEGMSALEYANGGDGVAHAGPHEITQGQDASSFSSSLSEEKISAAAAPRPRPVENPGDNVEVITQLVLKEVLPMIGPSASLADISETTKTICARKRIAYDSEVVRKAIDSALHRRQIA